MLPYYISLWLVPMKEDATYRIPIISIDTGQTIFTRVIDHEIIENEMFGIYSQ